MNILLLFYTKYQRLDVSYYFSYQPCEYFVFKECFINSSTFYAVLSRDFLHSYILYTFTRFGHYGFVINHYFLSYFSLFISWFLFRIKLYTITFIDFTFFLEFFLSSYFFSLSFSYFNLLISPRRFLYLLARVSALSLRLFCKSDSISA